MSRKEKKERRTYKDNKTEMSPEILLSNGEIDESSFSMECYDCCCFDCSDVDLNQLTGKINFSLDNLCCDLGRNPKEKKKKKKKSKKKSRTSSPIIYDGCEKYTTSDDGCIPKALPPKTFNLDPLSDQLKASNRSFSTNDLPGFKGTSMLKTKKKASKKYTKLCNAIKPEPPASFKNLCSRFKSSSLTNLLPITRNDTVKTLVNLSDHDKKILDRMSMKNLKEIALVENAMMARKYWEDEKMEREKTKNEQHLKYLKLVNDKRLQEHKETTRRRKIINEKYQDYCSRVQTEIEAKMIRSENILKNIEMEREMMECRKRQRELQRFEAINSNCEEKNLDEQIWRESINEKIEEKIHKAEHIRSKNLDFYRTRVQTDNQIHQQLHAQHYEEAMKEEIKKREVLKQKIYARDSKYKKFDEERQRHVQQLKAQAKTSSLLRELVRRSFGSFKIPSEHVNYQKQNNDNGRFSNCSYTTQVSHIHLS